ncbi:MAG TPA: hypothetical protein VFI25_13995 [Planctomycetota bacterium]|nr:hypothetical protein [Planctomycetota bacterium]
MRSVDGAADWLRQLLSEPELARRLGSNGREHVRRNFLLTRHRRDYLLLSLFLEHREKDLIALRRGERLLGAMPGLEAGSEAGARWSRIGWTGSSLSPGLARTRCSSGPPG